MLNYISFSEQETLSSDCHNFIIYLHNSKYIKLLRSSMKESFLYFCVIQSDFVSLPLRSPVSVCTRMHTLVYTQQVQVTWPYFLQI